MLIPPLQRGKGYKKGPSRSGSALHFRECRRWSVGLGCNGRADFGFTQLQLRGRGQGEAGRVQLPLALHLSRSVRVSAPCTHSEMKGAPFFSAVFCRRHEFSCCAVRSAEAGLCSGELPLAEPPEAAAGPIPARFSHSLRLCCCRLLPSAAAISVQFTPRDPTASPTSRPVPPPQAEPARQFAPAAVRHAQRSAAHRCRSRRRRAAQLCCNRRVRAAAVPRPSAARGARSARRRASAPRCGEEEKEKEEQERPGRGLGAASEAGGGGDGGAMAGPAPRR